MNMTGTIAPALLRPSSSSSHRRDDLIHIDLSAIEVGQLERVARVETPCSAVTAAVTVTITILSFRSWINGDSGFVTTHGTPISAYSSSWRIPSPGMVRAK
jgi:hypothetical protein